MSKGQTNESSISLQSANDKMPSRKKIRHARETSLPQHSMVESESVDGASQLTQLYAKPEFVRGWNNDVSFHIAQNVYHLRKYRELTQKQLADLMATSQSAIARIEGGDENITLSTLKRLITELRGRLHISFAPEESDHLPLVLSWWKHVAPTTSTWSLSWIGHKRDASGHHIGVILSQPDTLPAKPFIGIEEGAS